MNIYPEVARDFNGRTLDIYGNEILATNGMIHQEIIQILQTG